MIDYELWTKEELREFIKNLEMTKASGAAHIQAPDGNQVAVRSLGEISIILRQLKARYSQLMGRPYRNQTGARHVELIFDNGYGCVRRPPGRRRDPFGL